MTRLDWHFDSEGSAAISPPRFPDWSGVQDFKEFAAGVICNAGTLGILIPPSIVMVVYAAAVEVSVGRMFLAGVIPGLLAGFMLMVAIYIMAKVKNLPKGVGLVGARYSPPVARRARACS